LKLHKKEKKPGDKHLCERWQRARQVSRTSVTPGYGGERHCFIGA
jgi:hypothetical protein